MAEGVGMVWAVVVTTLIILLPHQRNNMTIEGMGAVLLKGLGTDNMHHACHVCEYVCMGMTCVLVHV